MLFIIIINNLFAAYNLFMIYLLVVFFFFFQAEDGIRDRNVTGVQTCALPISGSEVSNALVLYNYSDEKSKIEQKRIEVLEKNVESTKELMGIAGSSYLEIIQAQSSLLNVQLSKVADDFNKMQAVVNLYYALGGGAK